MKIPELPYHSRDLPFPDVGSGLWVRGVSTVSSLSRIHDRLSINSVGGTAPELQRYHHVVLRLVVVAVALQGLRDAPTIQLPSISPVVDHFSGMSCLQGWLI